jgi:hypothetical protein
MWLESTIARPVDQSGGVEAAAQLAVQALPNAGGGHHPPRHVRQQHEHDRSECDAVVDARAAHVLDQPTPAPRLVALAAVLSDP